MKRLFSLCATLLLAAHGLAGETPAGRYAVVVSPETMARPDWAEAVRVLQARHAAELLVVAYGPAAWRDALRRVQPRYVGFVARPEEIDQEYVARIHRTARVLDADPYEDFLWGIITGATAKDALRLARGSDDLTVGNVVSLTNLRPEVTTNLLVLSDQQAGGWRLKERNLLTNGVGGNSSVLRLLDFLSRHEPDAVMASGHASPFNFELSYRQGAVVSAANRLYLLDPQDFQAWVALVGAGARPGDKWYQAAAGQAARTQWAALHPQWELPLSASPKVFLAAGTCLVGNPLRSADSLVVTLLSAGGFSQCVGYTLEPKTGAGGWGTLRLWEALAGSVTLTEAAYLAGQELIGDLVRECPVAAEWLRDNVGEPANAKEAAALRARLLAEVAEPRRAWLLNTLHDLDGLAIYGDPRWAARLCRAGAEASARWETVAGGWCLRLMANRTAPSTGRYLFLLPERSTSLRVTDAGGLSVGITDDIAIIEPFALVAGQERIIRFASAPGEGTFK
jgi:zinc protease